MKIQNKATLELSQEEMKSYGYEVVDAIVEHFVTQNDKLPVVSGSRSEMEKLFLEEAPENPTNAKEVLNFVLDEVMTKSNIVSIQNRILSYQARAIISVQWPIA